MRTLLAALVGADRVATSVDGWEAALCVMGMVIGIGLMLMADIAEIRKNRDKF